MPDELQCGFDIAGKDECLAMSVDVHVEYSGFFPEEVVMKRGDLESVFHKRRQSSLLRELLIQCIQELKTQIEGLLIVSKRVRYRSDNHVKP